MLAIVPMVLALGPENAVAVPNSPVVLALWVLADLLLLGLVLLGLYAFSLPLRRAARAELFLDILQSGLAQGKTLEHTITSLARLKDLTLGSDFSLLAAFLEKGQGLRQALSAVPGFLPPQIVAMLDVGLRTGDPTRVFPACRRLLADARSRTQSAESYLLLLHAFLLPVVPVVFLILMVWVIPKYVAIAADMEAHLPPLLLFMMSGGGVLTLMTLIVSLLFFGLVVSYVAGPRGNRQPKTTWQTWRDRGVTGLPWRWKRLQRDFSGLLALLLDAGLPEAEAVSLAAQSTANAQMEQRAQQAIQDLKQGVPLARAIQPLDTSGELQWRLANAVHQKGGFTRMLQGWQEALDAKAYQLEQAAAHITTTVLVLLNGVLVALIVTGIFSLLISMINQQVLW